MKLAMKSMAVALLCAGAASCSSGPAPRAAIIDENVAVARQQIGMLADASEAGGQIRIPSTFKQG